MTRDRAWSLAALAITMAGVAACFGLWHGLVASPDATNRLRDDAFYEFAWAANLAAGHGPTVSDGVTTSGVQLLWTLCLVPLAWVGGAEVLPRVAPWLGFGLHCAAALLWLWGSRDRVAGLCIGLTWLGNPLLVRESQNGQETALACLCLVGLWLARRGSARWFVGLAVTTVLARSDLFAVVVALAWWRQQAGLGRAWLAPAVAFAGQTTANLLLGGGWLPDSAMPMAWLWHENHAAAAPGWSAWLHRSWWFLRPVLLGGPYALASAMGIGLAVFAIVRPYWPVAWRVWPALAVGCASALGVHDLATPAWVALLLALLPAPGRRKVPFDLLLLLAGLVAMVTLHWAVRWYPRDYYAAPLVVAAAAAVWHYGRSRLLLAVFSVAQILDAPRVQPEPLAAQQEMVMAGRFLAEVLPAGERVGCFNSGLVTFYADVLQPGRRQAIVNLDGVVNAPALAALRRHALGAWLDEHGVRFVLDNPVQFSIDARLPHANGLWFGEGFDAARDLCEIARFDLPGIDQGRAAADSMRLYWRRGRGAVPPPPPRAVDLGQTEPGLRLVLWPAKAGRALAVERSPGRLEPLLEVPIDTTVVIGIEPARLGTGRLFEIGRVEPVLVLPPL